jgi:hypothetical protein
VREPGCQAEQNIINCSTVCSRLAESVEVAKLCSVLLMKMKASKERNLEDETAVAEPYWIDKRGRLWRHACEHVFN